jgi:protein-tyrosine phosphatase
MFESLFRKQRNNSIEGNLKNTLTVDVHSHILPSIDDGAENLDISIEMLREFKKLGYQKVITTPHVMRGYYNNSVEEIKESLTLVREAIIENQIDIEIEAAAEYYLDESFLDRIERSEHLLTFDSEKKYLLFETSFIGYPPFLIEAVVKLKNKGYTPVLAHPERYTYLQRDLETLYRLHNLGVLFQVNTNSLTGFYSKQAQAFAEWMIERSMASFLGSDCHNLTQLENLKTAMKSPHYQMAIKQNLLNNSLTKKRVLIPV